MNRHLASFPQGGILRAVSFGGLSHALRGSISVATFSNLETFSYRRDYSEDTLARIRNVFDQTVDDADGMRKLLHEHGNIMIDNLHVLNDIDTENYSPANGAVYPGSTYGRQLQQIAQLIKEDVGLEVVSVNTGGWDTHSNQGGAQGIHADRLAGFAGGIGALYQDLGTEYKNDVVILTMTEFGRTALQNASNGTDHGNASAWFVIGGGVNGGIYGGWPGLQPEQLYRGRYLAHTIEYRDVMAEIIYHHLGNSAGIGTVLPGHTYQSVGFI